MERSFYRGGTWKEEFTGEEPGMQGIKERNMERKVYWRETCDTVLYIWEAEKHPFI
jgi:hypothetical protein